MASVVKMLFPQVVNLTHHITHTMQLDDEGFVKVQFLDSDGSVMDMARILAKMKLVSEASSKPSEPDGKTTLVNGVAILTELKKLADNGELTREKLLSVEYTDLLRFATYSKASEFIQKEFHVRGLPMKPEFTLMPHQIKTIEWMRQREVMSPAVTYGIKGGVVSLRMGLGKCHGRDTPILMWDGTIKKVQDVQTGELICGDDSTPRRVLSRACGWETMYRITPTKGDSYVVNASHILSLKISGNRGIYWDNAAAQYFLNWFDHERYTFRTKRCGPVYETAVRESQKVETSDIVDISVIDFVALPRNLRDRFKGYRTGVEWPEQSVPIEPYILGAWLGDGTSAQPEITNIDEELLDYVREWTVRMGYEFKHKKNSISYRINKGFVYDLRNLGVMSNKHVPMIYKRNSRDVRLQILAGLIDTDGSLIEGCYEISQKVKRIAEDILFLARSLGFAAYMSESHKYCWHKGTQRWGVYWRICISGEISEVPTKITRKQAAPRQQKKSVLVSNITVEKLDWGFYYGFVLDGNHRYLLGDFTVTHNTAIALAHVLTASKGEFPTLIVGSKTVVNEWKTQGVEKFFGTSIKALYVHKDYISKHIDALTRAEIKTYDIVITTYDTLKVVCRKFGYHEECQEMGDEHTLMKGKVVTIHTRTRQQADRPELVGARVLYGTPWRAVICDESQVFANPKTFCYKAVMALYGDNKWLLTGTPIRNYDTDIWAQLRFLGYSGVTTAIAWKRTGQTMYLTHNLKSVIFTMDYQDAGVKLPTKHEMVVPVTLAGNNLKVYEYMLGETRAIYDQMMARLADFSCVLVMFLRLRQTAIAPYLLTAESKREKPGKKTGKALEAEKRIIALMRKMKDTALGVWCHDKKGEAGIRSPKMLQVVDVVKKMPKGTKVLIFSSFAAALDLVADTLDEFLPKVKYVQIDGSVVGNERYDTLEQFRKDPSVTVFLGTYKCCSEGLNLTEATRVICLEEWWCPSVKQQAVSRSFRNGQKNEVYVHHFLAHNTIEERMLEICKGKQEMADSYLEGTAKPLGKHEGLDKYTLGRILGVH